MYALTGAVASRAEDAKMDKIMAVNKKLPTEFQVVLVKTLLAKDKSLFNHASVQSWVSANANVIL